MSSANPQPEHLPIPPSHAAADGLGYVDHTDQLAGTDLAEMILRLQEELEVLKNPMDGLQDEIRRYRGVLRGVLLSLMSAIEAKHPATYQHCRRVSAFAILVGRELRLSERDLETIEYGALLHDVGNIGMPEELLAKRSALSDEEEMILRGHTTRGDRIIRKVPDLDAIANIVRSHHERLDGSGYPDGLAGDEIPFLARVVAVADTLDAIAIRRSSDGENLPFEPALSVLKGGPEGRFDPDVVEAMACLRHDPVTVRVLANDVDAVSDRISPSR